MRRIKLGWSGQERPRSVLTLYLPDIMRRWEREIGRWGSTDERLRDIVALNRVLSLNIQDVEFKTNPSLKRDNRLSVDVKYF